MNQKWVLCLVLITICANSNAETYKCKTVAGNTEISDQPCRDSAKTVTVMQKEYISESQRKSSTEWIQRGADRLQKKEQAEAAAEREAQRQDAIRQAAWREEQKRQQESMERQRLADEMARLRQETAEAKEAAAQAGEAAAAAAAAAASKKAGGSRPCRIVGTRCYP